MVKHLGLTTILSFPFSSSAPRSLHIMGPVFHFRLTSWSLVTIALVLFLASAAPGLNTSLPNFIPDHYIFVMRKNLSDKAWHAHKTWSSSLPGTKKWVFESGTFKGYCGEYSQETVRRISADDDVSIQTHGFALTSLHDDS